MMDCRQVKQLLPLWIGRDLPDSSSAAEVASHLEHCPHCDRQRSSLQSSLDSLQSSSAETLSILPGSPSVWPRVSLRIAEWESAHRRERFNGWIPASVMALAVVMMIAVSIPSIHQEFFGEGSSELNTANLFNSDPQFKTLVLDDGKISDERKHAQRPAFGTPVNFKVDQW